MIGKGATVADAPMTNRIFRMSAPITLPTRSSRRPLVRLAIAVANSGSDVPNATKVAAITTSGTPIRSAITIPDPISIWLAIMIIINPIAKVADNVTPEIFLFFC